MERSEQRRVVEALVLSAPEPIPAARIAQIAPDCTPALAKELVQELNEQYQDQERSFEIWEVAGGYQLRTRAEFSGYLQQLQKHRPLRLSRAALETLSIVAYKQPVTRGEIEQVRGVDVGAVVKSLMERHLVRVTGQREVPGRPMLYGTTRRFLEIFGLESLKGLPTLRELEEIARERGIENPEEVLGLDLIEGQGEGAGESAAEDPGAGEAKVAPEAPEIAGNELDDAGETLAEEAYADEEHADEEHADEEYAGGARGEDAGRGALAEEVFSADNESPPEGGLPRFGHGEEPYSPFAGEDTHAGRFAAGGEDTHAGRFAAGGEDTHAGRFAAGGEDSPSLDEFDDDASGAEDLTDEGAILERE